VAYSSIVEMAKEGLQSPLIAVAVLLSFVGLFVLFAVLFRLAGRAA
jgi:hypothetical protein